MSADYQKINTLFMRDEKGVIIPSEMTCEEFEYLKDCKWEATEKIDGTNIHIDFVSDGENGLKTIFNGRTAKANIPSHLLSRLHELFTPDKLSECFSDQLEDIKSGAVCVSIYGEGYGTKIQKGGNYIQNGVDFILFDVRVGKWWLKRSDCESIAQKMGLKIVPLIGYMTIPEAMSVVQSGFKSTIAENKEYDAEGLVLKTPCGLSFRNGERIITKIKTCDFRKYNVVHGNENKAL